MISKVHVHYNPSIQGLEFRYIERDPITGYRVAASTKMVPLREAQIVEPFFTIKDGDNGIAQEMFDALWRHGIRPTDLGTIDSTLAAKDKHLEDLRKIAFHTLKVPNA